MRLKRGTTELLRRLRRRPHVVSVFLDFDDPYSYLLSYYLPELAEYYDVELRLYLTEAVQGAFRPAPDLYSEYALHDCQGLARELGVPFLDKGATPVVEHRRHLLEALAAVETQDGFETEVIAALAAYWRGDAESVSRRVQGGGVGASADAMLDRNQILLTKLGHYNTAMLHYGGEWYWGVDRLHYLVARLGSLSAARLPVTAPKITSIHQVMALTLPVKPPLSAARLPPLELFYSFRSPYSYLSLKRVFRIADAFGVELRIRPVLPMVMRGMLVPKAKLLYIMFDACREARRRKIPFGKIADPVGAGVERCMAAYEVATGKNSKREFLLCAGEAIWSRAIDVASDDGLREVTALSSIAWPDVCAAIDEPGWRQIAEDNRCSMMESGSWGVPTLRMGAFVTWGQDRDWLLVRHIERLCDTGDGILV